MVVSQAEKPAETEYGVGYPAAELVDHDPFDRADLVAVSTIDRGALDLVTADEAACLVFVHRHLRPPFLILKSCNRRGRRWFLRARWNNLRTAKLSFLGRIERVHFRCS